jgi:hypothetical protein
MGKVKKSAPVAEPVLESMEPVTELEKILLLCAKVLAKDGEDFVTGTAKVKKFVTRSETQYPNCNSYREPKVYSCGLSRR